MASMASACALVMSASDSAKLFGPLRYWRTRQAASTCVLVTISAICVCVLVVCGVLLAREYSLAKGYERTSCGVSNVTYASTERSCHFCSGHKEKSRDKGSTGACVLSSFPCLRIYVVYNIGSTVHKALLHPDSIQAAGLYRECSFSVCMKEQEDNRRAAEEYASVWRSQSRKGTFECFYNTADYEDVIAEKVYSQSDVIHSMLWPSVVIVICCAVFLRLETRRRHLTLCGRRPPPNESSAVYAGGAGGSRCATPETRDVRVVVVRSSSSAGRFPGPNCSPSHLVSGAGVDVKPWKSYSSLEQVLLAKSSRPFESRDLVAKKQNKHEVRPMTSSQGGADVELKVVRDERKLSLNIPGDERGAKMHSLQFPRGSCNL